MRGDVKALFELIEPNDIKDKVFAMGLHLTLKDSSPANRTVNLALSAVTDNGSGVMQTVYKRLSSLMCWDAMLYCAWAANGINCADVDTAKSAFPIVTENGTNFQRIFGAAPFAGRVVTTIYKLITLPIGAMIGFIDSAQPPKLRHAMIHVGNGWGAGNKNDCVLSVGHSAGWERLDMSAFFLKDKDYNGNSKTTMIFQPVTRQTI